MNQIVDALRKLPSGSALTDRPEGAMQRVQCISGSTLKLIALLTMMIDHVGAFFLIESPSCTTALFTVFHQEVSVYFLSRLIGRIAFPIYCFLIAEGAHHTRNRLRYGVNLLGFALLTVIPWNLLHENRILVFIKQNVFFTLLMGFLCICLYDLLRHKPLWCLAALGVMFAVSLVFHSDYGTGGMALILMLYLLRDKRIASCVLGICFTSSQWKTIPGYFLIALYNGKRGFIRSKVMKYLFYAAYPAHLLVYWMIKVHTIGY